MMIAIARGITLANDRTLLKEYDGHIEFNKSWAQSIHRRLGYPKRKATISKAPVAPGLLKEVGFTYHRPVYEVINAHKVPDALVINLDQTALPSFLISQYIIAKKGEKSVPITNVFDKRQITGTFAVTLAGDFLPIQIIYQGKTDRCHPEYKFPEKFRITHTENHWPNEEKCKEFVNKALMPYVNKKRQELKLQKKLEWLLIADVFKGQYTQDVQNLVLNKREKMVLVPNNMTNIFRPLDLTANRVCKAFVRKESQLWFSEQLKHQIQRGCAPEEVKVDVQISILKPLQAKWLTSFYNRMQNRGNVVIKGWKRAGISDFLSKERQHEDPFL